MVHVALAGLYLLLHLGHVLFQVNLDAVEPGAEEDTERQHPRCQGGSATGFGSNLGADPQRSSSFRREDWTVGLVSMHSSKGDNSLFGLYPRREGQHPFFDLQELEVRPGGVGSSSFTPFPRWMLRAGSAGHELYQSLNDFSRRCLLLSQKVLGEELNEEGVAFPPEFVVTGHGVPAGKKKTKS